MEKEIKVGDRVRVSEDVPAMYVEGINRVFAKSESEVEVLADGNARIFIETEDSLYQLVIPCKYLIKVDPDAEEDARIRQKEAELEAFRKSELDRVLYPEKFHTYEVTVDNVAMDWQRYEAALAKEVALKVANKYTDPKEAAEYAVSVAKAVVEGLKKK